MQGARGQEVPRLKIVWFISAFAERPHRKASERIGLRFSPEFAGQPHLAGTLIPVLLAGPAGYSPAGLCPWAAQPSPPGPSGPSLAWSWPDGDANP